MTRRSRPPGPGRGPLQSCRASVAQPAFDGPGRRAVDRYPVGERRSESGGSWTVVRKGRPCLCRHARLIRSPSAAQAPFQRLERALQERIEVVAGLQKRGRPEVDLLRKLLHFGFDGSRGDIDELNVAIALVQHRQADEDVFGIRQVIAKKRSEVIEQALDVLPPVCDRASDRIRDRAEEHHLALVDEPLQEYIEHLAVQVRHASRKVVQPFVRSLPPL